MLKGKTALVTGAGRGIGSEIAYTLGKNGAYVIVNYHGSKEAAEDTVKRIEKAGGRAVAVQCDVSDFQKSEGFVKDMIKQCGRIDILVNNAGLTKDNLIVRMTEEDYDRVLDTNLKGAFNMIHHLSRFLIKQRSGKIINISSVSGVIGNAGQANYAASKAGLIGLTKSVARELAVRNICVNAIAPGFIQTRMTQELSEKAREDLLKTIPMGRMGSPEDIANMALFLSGDKSDYITGQVFCVDGGMAM